MARGRLTARRDLSEVLLIQSAASIGDVALLAARAVLRAADVPVQRRRVSPALARALTGLRRCMSSY